MQREIAKENIKLAVVVVMSVRRPGGVQANEVSRTIHSSWVFKPDPHNTYLGYYSRSHHLDPFLASLRTKKIH
jgi:hypothetical protein